MDEALYHKAEKLAQLPHQVEVMPDETTVGTPVYVARIPQLPGCTAHGKTVEEAKSQLSEIKQDFIYFLLIDGLDVPVPSRDVIVSNTRSRYSAQLRSDAVTRTRGASVPSAARRSVSGYQESCVAAYHVGTSTLSIVHS